MDKPIMQTGKPSLQEWCTPAPSFDAPGITLWWNDDGVFLICKRPECLVDGHWAYDMDVSGMTLEQAMTVRDEHLKEKHSIPVKGLRGEVIGTAYTPDNKHLLMEIGEEAARQLGMLPDLPHVSFCTEPYKE